MPAWADPVATTNYATWPTALKDRADANAKMDFTGWTGIPTGAIAFNNAASPKRFDRWNGTTWDALDLGDAKRANNLSDLANVGTARTNLGLGSIATQAASAVAITGGTIGGITMDANWAFSGTRNFVANTSSGSDTAAIGIGGGGILSRGGSISLYGNNNGNTGKVVLSAGNVTNGTINFETGGALKVYIDQTGNFLAANDDSYELGTSAAAFKNLYLKRRTWTPTITPTGSVSAQSLIYARYTRVGKIIKFSLAFGFTSGSGVNNFDVTLPSTAANLTNRQGGCGVFFTSDSVYEPCSWIIQNSGTSLVVRRYTGNFGGSGVGIFLVGEYEEA